MPVPSYSPISNHNRRNRGSPLSFINERAIRALRSSGTPSSLSNEGSIGSSRIPLAVPLEGRAVVAHPHQPPQGEYFPTPIQILNSESTLNSRISSVDSSNRGRNTNLNSNPHVRFDVLLNYVPHERTSAPGTQAENDFILRYNEDFTLRELSHSNETNHSNYLGDNYISNVDTPVLFDPRILLELPFSIPKSPSIAHLVISSNLDHSKHSSYEESYNPISLNYEFEKFLQERGENTHKSKKSHLSENHYKSLKPEYCSFVKPGIAFCCHHMFTFKFDQIDMDKSMLFTGILNFKDNEKDLKTWLKSHFLNYNYEERRGGSQTFQPGVLPIYGEIIDFQNFDLRYLLKKKSRLSSGNNETIVAALRNHRRNQHMRKTSTFNGITGKKFNPEVYTNSYINKQLARWLRISPFSLSSYENFIQMLTCQECIAALQERYAFFKIYFTYERNDCDLLMSIDRVKGVSELIQTDPSAKLKSIINENTTDPAFNQRLKREANKVYSLNLQNKLYQLESFKIA